MARETVGKTFLVAFSVCVVFSVLVSTAAVTLRPIQEINKLRDKKKNILQAAGITEQGKSIDELFAAVEAKMVDLASGEYVAEVDPETYEQRDAAKDLSLSVEIAGGALAGIKRRAKYAPVYLVKKGDAVDRVILPVHGKGLWSTLYGFVALDAKDMSTIKGLVFYEHAETPGLGGEVDNPNWQALWNGKMAFGPSGDVRIEVIRGRAVPGLPGSQYQVDGLSGATITSRGVSGLIRYWLGRDGFGPYLDKMRT